MAEPLGFPPAQLVEPVAGVAIVGETGLLLILMLTGFETQFVAVLVAVNV